MPGLAPTVAYSGFTTVLDLAVGPDGSLYVVEHSTGPVFFVLPGRLLKIAPDGTRTTVIAGLTRPTAVAVSPEARSMSPTAVTPSVSARCCRSSRKANRAECLGGSPAEIRRPSSAFDSRCCSEAWFS